MGQTPHPNIQLSFFSTRPLRPFPAIFAEALSVAIPLHWITGAKPLCSTNVCDHAKSVCYVLCTNRLSTQFKILRVKSSATVQHPLSNGQLTRIGVSSGFTGCHILLVAHGRQGRHQCVMSLRMPGHQFCQLALLE